MSSRIIGGKETRRRMIVRDDFSKGIQKFDEDNIYPQRMEKLIASSVTAAACRDLMKRHLRGNGFAIPELENLVVDSSGTTLGQLHNHVCDDRSYIKGYAIHVGYNGLLEINSLKYVPFAFCRMLVADDTGTVSGIKIYEDWDKATGKTYDDTKAKIVDFFTTDKEKIAAQIQKAKGFSNWNGHIIWVSEAGKFTYPLSVIDAAIEDVSTEAGIKEFNYQSVNNGFTDKVVAVYKGKFASDQAAAEYSESLNNFQGAENSKNILLIEAEKPEDVPEWKTFESPKDEKRYDWTYSTVMEEIIRAYGQPLALQSIKTAGQLGQQKEFEEAEKLYDRKLKDLRNSIAVSFKPLLALWHEPSIRAIEDYSVIPISGIEEKAAVAPIAERLDVGTFQSMMLMLADTTIVDPVKINRLQLIFGFSKEEAEGMVLTTPIIQNAS